MVNFVTPCINVNIIKNSTFFYLNLLCGFDNLNFVSSVFIIKNKIIEFEFIVWYK
jgi:hypothetical protein